MKLSRLFLLIPIVTIYLGATSCERHSWDDVKNEEGEVIQKGTKRLFVEHHGDHAGHDDHAKHDGHEDHGHSAHDEKADEHKDHGNNDHKGHDH